MLFRKKNKVYVSDFETQREETPLKNIPLVNNEWNIPFLYEYLVEVNYDRGRENIALTFFDQHLSDVKLAKILLEEFLLNDEYDGSEWWEYKELPKEPETIISIPTLFPTRDTNYEYMFLIDFNKKGKKINWQY